MRGELSNPYDFNQIINDNYEGSFGLDLNGLLKAFTTKSNLYYVPHYQSGVVSGIIGSLLLNPYGGQSIFEGLVYGTGRYPPNDVEGNESLIRNNRFNIRSFGLKTPQTFVGWGYDIFGYPSPNECSGWNATGIYGSDIPTNRFASTPSGVTTTGAEVTQGMWNAGPLDLRWDNHRKVWTGNQSVYAAYITNVYNTGRLLTEYSTPYFAEDLTYDVAIYDGMNSGITVTGIPTLTQRPQLNTYKVYPIATGDFAFIVHNNRSGRPSFGIYAYESPFAEDCTASSADALISLIQAGSGISYEALSTTPLEYQYGGTGFSTYNDNDVLLGIGDGILGKRILTQGSGITISVDDDYLTVQLSDNVGFLTNGVNTTITALSGLTTPLSINQGGTSATGKIFVDLFSNQSISGIKNFGDIVRFSNGSISVPSISFISGVSCGWNHNDYVVNSITSGTRISDIHPTGSNHYRPVWIKPEEGFYSSLIVQQRAIIGAYIGDGYQYNSTDIQQWRNQLGVTVAEVGMSGHIGGTNIRVYNSGRTGYINLITNTGIITPTDIYLPSQTGTLALKHEIGGGSHTHVWNETPTGIIDGVNDTFTINSSPSPPNSLMLFRNGLLLVEGVSNDFVLSGTGIVFNVGNIPILGSRLICSYTI